MILPQIVVYSHQMCDHHGRFPWDSLFYAVVWRSDFVVVSNPDWIQGGVLSIVIDDLVMECSLWTR